VNIVPCAHEKINNTLLFTYYNILVPAVAQKLCKTQVEYPRSKCWFGRRKKPTLLLPRRITPQTLFQEN
jgi:hypothetical protein